MILDKQSYLYRIRIVFEPDGKIEFVETVHRTIITEDGKPFGQPQETVALVPVADLTPAVTQLLAEIEKVKK